VTETGRRRVSAGDPELCSLEAVGLPGRRVGVLFAFFLYDVPLLGCPRFAIRQPLGHMTQKGGKCRRPVGYNRSVDWKRRTLRPNQFLTF
jgi:hypothetical protein